MQYNDAAEVVWYVWKHYQHLLSGLEIRVDKAILAREKASAVNNPNLAKRLEKDLGFVLDEEVNKALADGPESFRRRVCQRLLSAEAASIAINRCPQCGRVTRAPRAKQCFCSVVIGMPRPPNKPLS